MFHARTATSAWNMGRWRRRSTTFLRWAYLAWRWPRRSTAWATRTSRATSRGGPMWRRRSTTWATRTSRATSRAAALPSSSRGTSLIRNCPPP
ncbi:hypothetical protein T484DRAFT_1895458, partial [Baffinella frigidus]